MITIIFIFEIVGTIVFSISGAITGVKKNADIFGVSFLAVTTAVGGGIIRDVLIGKVPPSIFTNYIFVVIAFFVSIFVFLSIYVSKNSFHLTNTKIDSIINVFDALGLGVFTVNGMNTVLHTGFSQNAFLIVFVGLCTGIGGGIIRDVLVNDIPFVLHKRIYAVASMVGGILYYFLYTKTNLTYLFSMTLGIFAIFIIRILAAKYQWNLPRINLKK